MNQDQQIQRNSKKKNQVLEGTLSEAAGTVSASVDEEMRGQPTVDGEESRIDDGGVDIWGEEKEGVRGETREGGFLRFVGERRFRCSKGSDSGSNDKGAPPPPPVCAALVCRSPRPKGLPWPLDLYRRDVCN